MTTALAERTGAGFTDEQLDLIKRTVANGASNDELQLFLYTSSSRGLDPLLKQIHGVMRWDDRAKRNVMSIQVGIDGYRLLAARTGDYAGNDDAVFVESVTPLSGLPGDYPDSATVTVYRLVQGMRCPFSATARWDEYYPGDKGGFMWRKMPHTMLGKCAEALALRKAFPAEMSGLYVDEEMHQAGPAADNTPRVIEQAAPTLAPVIVQEQPRASFVERQDYETARAVAARPAPKPNTEGTGPLIHEADPLWKAYTDLAAEAGRFRLAVPNIAPPIRQSELVRHGKSLREAVNERKAELAAQQTAIFGSDEDGTAFADLPASLPKVQDARPRGEASPSPSPAGKAKGKTQGVPMVESVDHPRYAEYVVLLEQAALLDVEVEGYKLNPPVELSKVDATIVALQADILNVERAESELATAP